MRRPAWAIRRPSRHERPAGVRPHVRAPSAPHPHPASRVGRSCEPFPGVCGTNPDVVAVSVQTHSGAGPSDAALVVAARAQERWAQEALFRRHAGLVNGLAYRLIGRDADLDDLVQDCFAEAWRSLGRLKEPAAFSSWLGAIVVRTAHKLLRRRRLLARLGLRAETPVDLDSLVSSAAPADVRAELHAVYRIVDSLPAATRVAFLLRRVEGLPLDEVASLTGASLATVKRRVAEGERRIGAASRGIEDPS